MKTLVAALITALLVFAFATAWTDVVQPRNNVTGVAAPQSARELVGRSSANRASRNANSADEDVDGEESSRTARRSKRSKSEEELNDITKERLLAQFDEVKRKEARLLEREEALNAICTEIRREIAEVDEIRRQSARELAMVERSLMDEIANSTRPTRQVQAPPAVAPAVTAKPKPNADARIAGVVQDLVDRGNINDAAILLGGFKERDIARILGTLTATNPSVAIRLAEQIRLSKLQASKPVDPPN